MPPHPSFRSFCIIFWSVILQKLELIHRNIISGEYSGLPPSESIHNTTSIRPYLALRPCLGSNSTTSWPSHEAEFLVLCSLPLFPVAWRICGKWILSLIPVYNSRKYNVHKLSSAWHRCPSPAFLCLVSLQTLLWCYSVLLMVRPGVKIEGSIMSEGVHGEFRVGLQSELVHVHISCW